MQALDGVKQRIGKEKKLKTRDRWEEMRENPRSQEWRRIELDAKKTVDWH